MSTITLCAIVKNEAHIIGQCLDSVQDFVDNYVIVDTGSTDGTQEIIRAHAVPGELHERPWVNFGHNRSEALAFAWRKSDYLLLLDADMTIEHNGKPDLTADAYMLRVPGDPDYRLRCLLKNDRRWYSVGATHEYTMCDEPCITENLDSIIVHHHCNGSNRPVKFQNDLAMLLQEYERDQNNPRTMFYLAQTFNHLGLPEQAVDAYKKRFAMGGWDQEAFYALYQAGTIAEDTELLLKAWEFRPTRAEPLYGLAKIHQEARQYNLAFMYAKHGLTIPIPDDILFVHRWIYDWAMLFEFSIAAYYAASKEVALQACDILLEIPSLPDNFRERVEKNRAFCLPMGIT